MRISLIPFFLTACALLTPICHICRAQETTQPEVKPVLPGKKLGPGDAAPPLKTGKWVKGEPLQTLGKDSVTIIEFWATWCGPCKATIPHLNDLHQKYSNKGVIFIGQNCFENETEKVEKFVADMGDKMAYRVALDDFSQDENGEMARTWMSAAKQTGIPCAFAVGKDGKIAWIGHPAKLTAEMLDQLTAGTFDVAAAATKPKLTDTAEASGPNFGALHAAVGEAVRKGEWPAAAEALKKLKAAMPPDELGLLALLELQLALGQENVADSTRLAGQVLSSQADNPGLLQNAAWKIACSTKEAALLEKAWQMTDTVLAKAPEGGKTLVLNVRARILFQQGKPEEAIKVLESALPTASERLRPLIEESIKMYGEGKAPQ